ncbi:MAG: hypothetical protein JWN41_1721 [Thermoleophilia bacterium]|nr:hypothetical protein [Thermoleophilia bacterium]
MRYPLLLLFIFQTFMGFSQSSGKERDLPTSPDFCKSLDEIKEAAGLNFVALAKATMQDGDKKAESNITLPGFDQATLFIDAKKDIYFTTASHSYTSAETASAAFIKTKSAFAACLGKAGINQSQTAGFDKNTWVIGEVKDILDEPFSLEATLSLRQIPSMSWSLEYKVSMVRQ